LGSLLADIYAVRVLVGSLVDEPHGALDVRENGLVLLVALLPQLLRVVNLRERLLARAGRR
jgi:hypothetical protein